MELTTRLEQNVLVIDVIGTRIDAACAIALKDQFRSSIDGHDGRVAMNMSNVKFMDSSGLGAMVAALKMLNGRSLALFELNPPVAKVFGLTRMDQVFDISSSLEEALSRNASDTAA